MRAYRAPICIALLCCLIGALIPALLNRGTRTKDIGAILRAPLVHQHVQGTDQATKPVIVTSIIRFVRFKTDSLEIIRLQKLVRTLSSVPGSTAMELGTKTAIDTSTRVIHDTVPCSFHQTIQNPWITARITYTGTDTAGLHLSVRNQYEVAFSSRHDSSFVQVRSLNPYTETTGLSAFQVPQKPRRRGKVWAALAAGIIGGYLLHH